MLNALKGLAATRHGEAAGLRWCNRFPELQPLGKLVVARSYDKDGTKTQVSRQVPIHPVLAQLLSEWWSFGWASVYGRRPTLKDYIVPRSIDAEPPDEGDGDLWPADQAYKLFAADLEALGMRVRRGHDLRRTFITLAQEDGARRDVLQVITHAPDAADVMSLYTTYPWSTLCAEVAKLQIALPDRPEAHSAVASSEVTSPKAPEAQMLASEMRPMEPREPAPAHAETNGAPRSFGEVDVAAGLSTFSTFVSTCRNRKPNDFEPLPGFEPGTYGLRRPLELLLSPGCITRRTSCSRTSPAWRRRTRAR